MAALEALSQPISKVSYMVKEFKERKDLIVSELNKIEGVKCNHPKGAFYVFPDISYYFGKTLQEHTIENATDFSMFLLEKANVATVTGIAFGNSNCIRISYAASTEEIKEAIKRIKEAVS
jgi:aspartate aminotransferase